jgi:hypothetical protein
MDGASQDMAADMRLQLGEDFAMLGQYIELLAGRQYLGGAGHAMDGRGVTRLDAKLRRQLAVEITPVTGLGRRMQLVVGHFDPQL